MPTGLRAPVSRTRSPLGRLAVLAVVAVAATTLTLPLGAQAAPTPALERRGLTQIIVEREPDLRTGQRADVRADADVALVGALPLPRTEVVEAEPGRLAEALAALNADPRIAYAVADLPLEGATNDPLWGDQWGLENVGQPALTVRGATAPGVADADVDAPEAWARTLGAGETIAVVDTGIDFAHPEFRGRIAINAAESGANATDRVDDDGNGYVDDVRGWDWIGANDAVICRPGMTTACRAASPDNDATDGHGHGTHVAGIASAAQDNGEGITGIAPGAQVLPLRILDASNGGGTLSMAVEAFAYAAARGARVVSASLGFNGTSRQAAPLEAVITRYPATLFVFAAGNGSPDHTDPARHPYDMDADPAAEARRFYPCALPNANIVCVGASDASDAPAAFSNWGARSVDVHAPGVGIVSASPGGGYVPMHGTSMAAPLVAGSLALAAASDRALSAGQLRARVLGTVDGKPALDGRSASGGRLNAAAALPLPRVSQQEPDEPASPGVAAEPSTPAPAPQPAASVPSTSAGTAAAGMAAGPSAPALSALRLSRRVLTRMISVRYRLDRPATVRLTLARKTCRNRRCGYKSARTITVSGRAGVNRLSLRRSAGGRRLPAGAYRLTARATVAGLRSAARTVALRVR